ncbi:hypothetical protein K9M41_00195 [Candidatus Gracilibacteria bacterium]|nr:hypothetical protein [Candidatus Gracilibacteria bacterium]
MKKICALSGKEFEITEKDLKFYEKMGVPVPTLCPEERQRRRIAYRNFRSLYRRKCSATGKMIISMYHEDQPFSVYENGYWWSDKWTALDYSQDFDFSRPFFEQYQELAQKVPRFATANVNCENSQYSNFAWRARNCYLVFGCVRDEDCLYGHIVWDCKDCTDNLYLFRCEWCSNCTDCIDCYNTHFSTECAHCTDSYFLHDCRSCRNCFGCVNLRNKQYYFFNKPHTKEEYEEKLKQFLPLTHTTIEQGLKWLEETKKTKAIFPPYFGVQNEDVSGDHLYECKNITNSFDAKRGEESKHLYTSYEQIHSQDISFTGDQTNFCYNCLTIGNNQDLICCHKCFQGHSLSYCEFCYSCHDCFGCNGLRNASYCIFNKQYSKEEYAELKNKIITYMKETREWGEFFPIGHSPFAYNEAIVNEYLPLTKEEVFARGLKWRGDQPSLETYEGPKYDVPGKIADTDDDILQKVLVCQRTGKNYRVTKQELIFYRKMGLPVPLLCPSIRHEERMKIRNARKLYERKCDNCGVDIETTFTLERPETVYCEKCYLEYVN